MKGCWFCKQTSVTSNKRQNWALTDGDSRRETPMEYTEYADAGKCEKVAQNGESFNFKIGWDMVFPVPGTFKLDQMQLIKPLLFWYFCIFFTFILGSQFLLPQWANNGKREHSHPQKIMRQWVFGAWGIQIGPFAAIWAHFVPQNCQLFHFHTGRPILITPEGQ